MRKFRIVHNYDIDVCMFEDICFNPFPEDEALLLKLENLQSREEIERREDERHIFTRARVYAVANLPLAVRSFIKPEMLSWIEETVYDKREHFWTWNVIPYYFNELLDCSGLMLIVQENGCRCRRITEGHVHIRVPLAGDIVEKYIVEKLKANLDQEYEMFQDAIKRRRERGRRKRR